VSAQAFDAATINIKFNTNQPGESAYINDQIGHLALLNEDIL
jgi:hypothetical protein